MADYVFGQYAGTVGKYVQDVLASLPTADSELIAVPFATSGTAEQAETLTTLAAVEADANFAEQTNASWGATGPGGSRKTLSSVTYAWDATNNRMEWDFADPTWGTPGSGPSTGNTTGLILCYVPDWNATGGVTADSGILPLVHLDFVITANGQQVIYQVNAEGAYHAIRV